MTIKTAFTVLVFFLPLSYVQAGKDTLVIPYDSLMDDRVSVDGYIDWEDEEYLGSFRDPATGITVYWGYDDNFIYIALEAKGKGWQAIGFGSPTMNGSNMFIGYYSDDSVMLVNHVGTGRTHAGAKGNDSLLEDWDIDYDEETNTMAIEFVYPLNWAGLKGSTVSGLVPGETYDLILARNPKSISFTVKHSQKSQRIFRLAPKPALEETKSKQEK